VTEKAAKFSLSVASAGPARPVQSEQPVRCDLLCLYPAIRIKCLDKYAAIDSAVANQPKIWNTALYIVKKRQIISIYLIRLRRSVGPPHIIEGSGGLCGIAMKSEIGVPREGAARQRLPSCWRSLAAGQRLAHRPTRTGAPTSTSPWGLSLAGSARLRWRWRRGTKNRD